MSLRPDEIAELRLDRIKARAKLIRLYRDYRRYRALYPTPWILRLVAALKAEYRATWEWKRQVEARLRNARP